MKASLFPLFSMSSGALASSILTPPAYHCIPIFAVKVEGKRHGVYFIERACVVVVIAGELNDIRAEVSKQVKSYKQDHCKKYSQCSPGLGMGSLRKRKQFVDDMSQVGSPHDITYFSAGEKHASVDMTNAVSRAMAVTPVMIRLVSWVWSRLGGGTSALT